MSFPHHYKKLHSLAALDEVVIGDYLGDWLGLDAGDFEDMDLISLWAMWEDGGSARVDMIEILISLALLKLKSML
jgi:hypothetical protein